MAVRDAHRDQPEIGHVGAGDGGYLGRALHVGGVLAVGVGVVAERPLLEAHDRLVRLDAVVDGAHVPVHPGAGDGAVRRQVEVDAQRVERGADAVHHLEVAGVHAERRLEHRVVAGIVVQGAHQERVVRGHVSFEGDERPEDLHDQQGGVGLLGGLGVLLRAGPVLARFLEELAHQLGDAEGRAVQDGALGVGHGARPRRRGRGEHRSAGHSDRLACRSARRSPELCLVAVGEERRLHRIEDRVAGNGQVEQVVGDGRRPAQLDDELRPEAARARGGGGRLAQIRHQRSAHRISLRLQRIAGRADHPHRGPPAHQIVDAECWSLLHCRGDDRCIALLERDPLPRSRRRHDRGAILVDLVEAGESHGGQHRSDGGR